MVKKRSEYPRIITAGAFYIPKDNPKRPRGDDAHFFTVESQVIAVADGVGGWSKKGVDAGEYARELMANAAAAVEGLRPSEVDPTEVLTAAYMNSEAPGTSTACVISVSRGFLRAANLGDSGFAVIRGKTTVFRSPVQHHRFNRPYQMGGPHGDTPVNAEKMTVALESGDVIVAGTDGLFDNIFLEEIEAMVAEFSPDDAPEAIAWTLATAAREQSLEKRRRSPFEMDACKAGFKHSGGKYDDVTVVVAHVA